MPATHRRIISRRFARSRRAPRLSSASSPGRIDRRSTRARPSATRPDERQRAARASEPPGRPARRPATVTASAREGNALLGARPAAEESQGGHDSGRPRRTAREGCPDRLGPRFEGGEARAGRAVDRKLAPAPPLPGVQRRGERRERELVGPHDARDGCAASLPTRSARPATKPGLRAREELVAGERHEVRSVGQAGGDGRLAGDAELVERLDAAGALVVQPRNAGLAGERRESSPGSGRSVKPRIS